MLQELQAPEELERESASQHYKDAVASEGSYGQKFGHYQGDTISTTPEPSRRPDQASHACLSCYRQEEAPSRAVCVSNFVTHPCVPIRHQLSHCNACCCPRTCQALLYCSLLLCVRQRLLSRLCVQAVDGQEVMPQAAAPQTPAPQAEAKPERKPKDKGRRVHVVEVQR